MLRVAFRQCRPSSPWQRVAAAPTAADFPASRRSGKHETKSRADRTERTNDDGMTGRDAIGFNAQEEQVIQLCAQCGVNKKMHIVFGIMERWNGWQTN